MINPTSQSHMGLAELADYFGVSKQAMLNRLARNEALYPEPVARLAMGRIWLTEDILAAFPMNWQPIHTVPRTCEKIRVRDKNEIASILYANPEFYPHAQEHYTDWAVIQL